MQVQSEAQDLHATQTTVHKNRDCGATKRILPKDRRSHRCACTQVAASLEVHRRQLLLSTCIGTPLAWSVPSLQVGAAQLAPDDVPAQEASAYSSQLAQPGPYSVKRLPRLEHTCSRCFPACIGHHCLLRLDVYYPGSARTGQKPPYPLAVISSGFLVSGASYASYAEHLASHGYVAITYDKFETATENINDVVSIHFIREILEWCEKDPILSQLADPSVSYLIGHSRGGKLSVLAAAADDRVKAVFCLDPVDNTVWAPESAAYPSALAALRKLGKPPGAPLAVIGGGLGGDCAPKEANFRLFYEATSAPAWQLLFRDTGHFQFLDSQSTLQRAVCAQGRVPESAVRAASQACMVAWGQIMVRDRCLKQKPDSGFGQMSRAQALHTVQDMAAKILKNEIVARSKNLDAL